MASFTIPPYAAFTVGATVNLQAYTDSRPPLGAVLGSATVAADGTTTFTGLASDTRYLAGVGSGGSWRGIDFRTGFDATDPMGAFDARALATDVEVAAAIARHNSDTTAVHGIADTAALDLRSGPGVVAQTVGDNSTDDTAAIIAALNALPAYSSGVGAGRVIIPTTPTNICKVSASIPLNSGQTIVGAGSQAPLIQGNFAGPIIDVQSGALYPKLMGLYVKNQSANAAAMALNVQAGSDFTAEHVHFHAVGVNGVIAHLSGALMGDFNHCVLAGTGAGACDHSILADAGSNVLRLRATSIRDTRTGVVAKQLHYLSIEDGCQFESLVGSPSDGYYGAVAVDDLRGGKINGYFEAVVGPVFASFNNIGVSRGLDLGSFYIENCTGVAGYAINLQNVSHSRVAPNAIYPGALNANLGGVDNRGTLAHTNEVSPNQYIESGTGLGVLGGPVEMAGPGSPAGVVSAYPGSRWYRTDGGAGTTLYVKETGTGTAGWAAK